MSKRSLSSSPGMLPLYARAAAGLVPGADKLPFVGGREADVPEIELELADVEVDAEHLAQYCKVCGFTLRDVLPATYPHILAFPLQLALMTDGSFPFPAIGLVHIGNGIAQHRPIELGERLSLRVSATKLEPHPRGRKFSLLTEARVGDELVWEERGTELHRESGGGERSAPPSPPAPGGSGRIPAELGSPVANAPSEQPPDSFEELPAAAEWRLPGDLGRRYAAVSGDRNPIHLHALAAKPFGFPRAIAHGMWTKARCLAALEGRLPEAYVVEVRLRRPILLPATVAFAMAEEGDRTTFAVRDAREGTPHLEGFCE